MALHGLSPKASSLERLLELAAGNGFSKACNAREEALIHALLTIVTRKPAPSSGLAAVVLGKGDMTTRLLSTAESSSGVTQALSLQALKTWAEDNEGCLQSCIAFGAVPLLLNILEAALPDSASDVAAAYSASMAVILLRAMVREGGAAGADSLLAAGGIETLVSLITSLQRDSRSLCLVLYLLNDVTRRSMEVLDRAIVADAVTTVVAVLRNPISEATKFAALILNRWSLAAQHLPAIRAAGAFETLLSVLERAVVGPHQSPDAEIVAYSLSAFAIMTQNATEAVRAELLACPRSLEALSHAVPLYEQCFNGVGFPHATMCSLIDGPDGAALIAAIAAAGLLPVWLATRHVGEQLLERAGKPDVLAALAATAGGEESTQVAVAVSHLLQRSPATEFLPAMIEQGRLEVLAFGALSEVIAEGPSSDDYFAPAPLVDFARRSSISSISSISSGEDVWNTSSTPELSPSPPQSPSTPTAPTSSASILPPSSIDTTAKTETADPCVGVVEDPKPKMPLLLTTPQVKTPPPFADPRASFKRPAPSSTAAAITTAAAYPSPRPRCCSALARLASWTRSASAGGEVEQRLHKRQRSVDLSPPFPAAFRREDVGVPRYDTLCFVAGGREVHAVGFVLEAHSSFLRGLLSTVCHAGERLEVPQLPAFSAADMHRQFLRSVEWCYTGAVEELSCLEDAFDLWLLADFLQINGLQRHCEATVARWFDCRPDVIKRSLLLADAYPSAGPLRRLVARHVLGLLDGREQRSEAALAVAAAAAAGQVPALGAAMAAELRDQLVAVAATF